MSEQLPLFDASRALVEYHSPDGKSHIVQYDPEVQTVRMNQREMAELFDVDVKAVNKHVKSFKEQRGTSAGRSISKMEIVADDGKRRKVEYYDLDVITFVGYNLHATERTIGFQNWVADIVKQFLQHAGKGPRIFKPIQSPMFRRAIDAGYTREEAEGAALIRERLKERTKETNEVRAQHGANDPRDFARLNALDSQVATGKTPAQWKKELGEDVTPADYLSPLDNISLAYEKLRAAQEHEANQSQGVNEMAQDIQAITPEVKNNKKLLGELLQGVPLPAPKQGKQLALKDGK